MDSPNLKEELLVDSSPNNNDLPPNNNDLSTNTYETSIITKTSDDSNINKKWTVGAIIAAIILFVGTTASEIIGQHISNDVPDYYFAIAVFTPFSGLIFYPIVVFVCHRYKLITAGLSKDTFTQTLYYGILIGLCFSIHNILSDYGGSGQSAGKPDVSTVLSLILQKLVVPVSLILEFSIARKMPSRYQIGGVIILMVGVIVTAIATTKEDSENHTEHSNAYPFKIMCTIISTIPLALGYWFVKKARIALPSVSAFELWMVLCLPETVFSIGLSFAGQAIKHTDGNMYTQLWEGLQCLIAGITPKHNPTLPCNNAAMFTWIALIPGYAFNLAIPVIIHHKGSTSVPLIRAVALPVASIIAMSRIDSVIATSFSWEGIIGVLLALLGLFVFYYKNSQKV